MKNCFKAVFVGFALVLLLPGRARAACEQMLIPNLDRGWYEANGNHASYNETYYCGEGFGFVGAVRNWAVFSVPALTQQVASASLVVYLGSMFTPTGSETFQLRHVSTPVSTLRAGGVGQLATYADLGDGEVFGRRAIAYNDQLQSILIPLNAAFVSNLMAGAGGMIAIGGEVASLDAIGGNYEFLFTGQDSFTNTPQLLLTFAGPDPLAIAGDPQSQVANAGDNVQFYADACGSSVLHFQWQHEGTDLPGANTALLSLPSVTSNDAGAYRLIVTNLSGAVTSAVANLSVIYQPPAVTAHLVYGTSPFFVSNTIGICASVSGIPAPSLQWQHNGTNVPGELQACLYMYNAQMDRTGDYTLMASNAVGVATSAVVSIVVTTPPPAFIYGASTQAFAVGSYVYLCSAVYTHPYPTFQWLFNGAEIPGKTDQCFFVQGANTNNAGLYSVVVSNSSGVYTSAPVDVTIYYQAPTAPYIYITGGSANGLVGNDTTICSSLGGSPPLTYQWRFNGAILPGQTAACLTLIGLETNQAGAYDLVVTNFLGSATSDVVHLTVNSQAPIFSFSISDQSVVEGATVRIWGQTLAGPPATHTLQLNGTNLAVPFSYDTDNSTIGGFTLLDVSPADAGQYRVIASNSLGMATSTVATVTIRPAGPLDRWTQRNPLPQSQSFFSITYGNGLFVGVGDHGTILTSVDGTNWFVQQRRVDLTLRGVAFGAGVFVAVGYGGTILSSADGTNWSYRHSSASTFLNAVAYGNGRFVATGSGPSPTFMITSTDGITWERVPSVPSNVESGITFGNGIFVAVGNFAGAISTNGFDWTITLAFLPAKLESVSFLQGQYIAVGDGGLMFVSPDGLFWNTRNSGTTRRLRGVTYGNGRYVAAGVRGTIVTSTDANTWTVANSGTPDRLETVHFANGLFVSAGENGTTITSTNGTAWTKQNIGITRDLDGMAVANGKIVIVGKGGSVLISTNGTHYTDHNAGVTNDLHGIAWANGLWVAVGEPNMIVTSSNALSWTSHSLGGTNSLKGATFGGGKWVVVGTQGTIATSANGTDWSVTTTTPPFDLNDVAYGNGRYVIAGDGVNSQNGSCFVSTDGVAWTWLNSFFPSKNLRSILFTNGLFVMSANDGSFWTSTNGLNWSFSYTASSQNLRGVTWAHGTWFAVGNRGTILSSTNLFTWVPPAWTPRPTRTFENLHEIVYLDGKLVAIGNRGTVLQSDRFMTELEWPRYEPGVGATLGVKGIPGRAYQLEASTDLLQWTNLFRFTNTVEETLFTDTNAVSLPLRFYRWLEQ
jgi:hypothetical protein